MWMAVLCIRWPCHAIAWFGTKDGCLRFVMAAHHVLNCVSR